MTHITNPYAWAIGYVKDGMFTIEWVADTRANAREWRAESEGRVIRKVFIKPAESVRRSR